MRTEKLNAAAGFVFAVVVMGLLSVLAPAAVEERTPGTTTAPAAAKAAPKVEVAFVLDTTGSMSGMIAGAKAKIWTIANQIVLGQPKPVVRLGLVPYRDKGDEYVTKVFDLTDNIDQVYSDLMGFQASGGGDLPEHVNKALFDAINKLSWSPDRNTLKIIYLVGDAPPHNEYTDTPTYDKLAKSAIEKGIYINTILCGNDQDAARVWQEIARLAEGKYFAVEQGGGVVEIATPFDGDLAKLNKALVDTVVVYGTAAEQAAGTRKNVVAKAMAAPAAASERATFAAATGRAGSQDLVQAVAEKQVKLSDLPKDQLPANMQKMSPEEQAKYVAAQQAARDEINKKVRDLSAQRATFIKQELEKTSGNKAMTGFDAKIIDALKAQAATKNILYN